MDREPEQIADEWLVLSAQSGSTTAMEALVRRWQPRLLAHARQVTGRTDVAADVVQEAWLAIMRSLEKLRDPAAFRSWAYRIVHARAVDWVRKNRRQRDLVDDKAAEEIPAPPASPHDAHDRQPALAAAIEKLDAAQRLLLRMFYLERMRVREIAAALGMPIGTVKYQLFQLRQELKSLIEGEEDG
ncbi:sigma-70 family RNA polymerase sigma factor [Bremerella sp. JC770]|uniref:RNA polymerase sigma factor n=1 Tax=Bremerella sp. JC770 TaxID=3232137 RepID=UPI00345A508F